MAIDYFHKALGLRRDDTFSTTMLTNSIGQLMNEMSPCDGAEETNSIFDASTLSTSNFDTSTTCMSASNFESSTISIEGND